MHFSMAGAVAAAVSVAVLVTAPAYAANERISVTQSTSNHVGARVDADFTQGCPVPSTALLFHTATAYLLVSQPSPACSLPGPTAPYSASVDLGILADGDYHIDWAYSDAFTIRIVTSYTFAVRGGLLVASPVDVPTLSAISVVVLALLIGVTAFAPRPGLTARSTGPPPAELRPRRRGRLTWSR